MRSRILLVVALWLGASACSLEATMTVRMASDGSGTLAIVFTADEELARRAAAFAGDDIFADLRTADLEAAGWVVTKDPPAHRIAFEHRFASPSELAQLIASLDPDQTAPILRGWTAARDHSTFSDTYRISGRVDLATGGSAKSVRELFQGVDAATVNRIAGGDISTGLSVRVAIDLPGSVGETTSLTRQRGVLVWTVGAGQVADIGARSDRRNYFALAAAAAAVVLLVIVVGLSFAVAGAARQNRRDTSGTSPDRERVQ